jgi:hypothetical protein
MGQELLPEFSGRVFPNPATEQIHVEPEPGMPGAEFTLQDGLGRVWKSGRVEQEGKTIQVEELPAGVYFLKLGPRWVRRVVVGF